MIIIDDDDIMKYSIHLLNYFSYNELGVNDALVTRSEKRDEKNAVRIFIPLYITLTSRIFSKKGVPNV